jgi:DNA polymerase III epsilon subunit family exonuclease
MIPLSTPLHLVRFVSVDVETTGLDPKRDQIVEMGAVVVQGGRVVGEFETLVYIDRTIPFQARRVHGISNEMLVGKPRIGDALPALLEFVGDGALVEHSSYAFDVLFLESAHGSALNAPYINTCTLSRRLFPHLPRHSLEECCLRFGLAQRPEHRALADARATAHLLMRLLELCSTRYPRLEDLLTVASVQRDGASGWIRHQRARRRR